MKRHIIKGAAALGALVLAFGAYHQIGAAQTTSSTITYSGYLEDEGTPVDGSREIGFNLWKTADTNDVANRVCEQAPETVTVSAGWFTVPVSDACLDTLRLHSSVYLEFVIGSTVFPLQPIGAVPFALRALEYESGARLRRKVRYADDGSKQIDTGTWFDTERGEECSFRTVPGGPADAGLCLPATQGGGFGCDGGGLFTDSGCVSPLDFSSGGSVASAPPTYVPSATSSSGLALPSAGASVYMQCFSLPCQAYTSGLFYAPATDIPAEAFVAWSEGYE